MLGTTLFFCFYDGEGAMGWPQGKGNMIRNYLKAGILSTFFIHILILNPYLK